MTWSLEDDGTLDTVISCDACGEMVRFDECHRDTWGVITEQGWEEITNEAAEGHDCAPEESE